MQKCRKAGIVALVSFLAVWQALAVIIYRKVFFVRCSKEIPKWEYTLSQFPDIKGIRAEFKNDKGVTLRGYFYCQKSMKKPMKEGKGVIVLACGYLQSHKDYLVDIAYLARLGFVVFGYDATGSYESDGRRMMGIDQAIPDLRAALHYVTGLTKGVCDLYLYGHSLGAYAGAVMLSGHFPIKKAVLRSGFYCPDIMIYDALKTGYGRKTMILIPFVFLYRMLLFGGIVCKKPVCALKKTNARVLLMHSEDDTVVPVSHSLYGKRKAFLNKENIMTRLYYGRGHDIVRSIEAMRYYFEKEKERQELIEKYGGVDQVPVEEIRQFEDEIDRKKANSCDEEILCLIGKFFEQE